MAANASSKDLQRGNTGIKLKLLGLQIGCELAEINYFLGRAVGMRRERAWTRL
jgi:hypothetical protein